MTITTLPQYFMYFYLCISRPTCQQTKVFTSAESITTRPQSFVFAAREIFEHVAVAAVIEEADGGVEAVTHCPGLVTELRVGTVAAE